MTLDGTVNWRASGYSFKLCHKANPLVTVLRLCVTWVSMDESVAVQFTNNTLFHSPPTTSASWPDLICSQWCERDPRFWWWRRMVTSSLSGSSLSSSSVWPHCSSFSSLASLWYVLVSYTVHWPEYYFSMPFVSPHSTVQFYPLMWFLWGIILFVFIPGFSFSFTFNFIVRFM